MKSLTVHGRQPALGRAELEGLYGADKLQLAGEKATLVDVDPCLLAFDRLGGSLKFCKVLTTLDTTNWKEIEKFLVEVSPGHSQRMPEGKMRLGLSAVGLEVGLKQLNASALTLKKAIKTTGRNVRVVPNKSLELNTAQVLHNQLTGPTGWELVFIRDGKRTIIAQTVKVQDIGAYTKRDRERPMRDTKVGMLPPKLAQIIINLSVGELPEKAKQSICEIPPDEPIPAIHFDKTVLDPFCGTGVILQEAALMGYDACGTDIDSRMVEYSRKNLTWLSQNYNLEPKTYNLKLADATTYHWPNKFDVVAGEVFLGRPLSSLPDNRTLAKIISDCDVITSKFLRNLAGQTKPGFRSCIAVPAWSSTLRDEPSSSDSNEKTKTGFKRLPGLEKLEQLGYNRLKFVHAKQEELIYHRPEQVVARELVVIERK